MAPQPAADGGAGGGKRFLSTALSLPGGPILASDGDIPAPSFQFVSVHSAGGTSAPVDLIWGFTRSADAVPSLGAGAAGCGSNGSPCGSTSGGPSARLFTWATTSAAFEDGMPAAQQPALELPLRSTLGSARSAGTGSVIWALDGEGDPQTPRTPRAPQSPASTPKAGSLRSALVRREVSWEAGAGPPSFGSKSNRDPPLTARPVRDINALTAVELRLQAAAAAALAPPAAAAAGRNRVRSLPSSPSGDSSVRRSLERAHAASFHSARGAPKPRSPRQRERALSPLRPPSQLRDRPVGEPRPDYPPHDGAGPARQWPTLIRSVWAH